MYLDENPLLRVTDVGLYCEQGGFFIDPWRAVDRAVVTHAHADHLCSGSGQYLLAQDGLTVARARLGDEPPITTVPYGKSIDINGVRLSLHPAGHILGSAQVRLEHKGKIWVISGDYKVEPDLTCAPFIPIPCHVFISECTFGLPVYRWPAQGDVFRQILTWWRGNQAAGRSSLLFAYALGKAQRLIAGLAATAETEQGLPGPIYTHGAVEAMNRAYRGMGIELASTAHVVEANAGVNWSNSLVIAPPSAHGSPWIRRFGPASTAFASGWMRLRGTRRRRVVDRGFVLSDHVDWPALLATIDTTCAETVWLTHGYTNVVTRWLTEQGKDAHAVTTLYEGERDDDSDPAEKSTNQVSPSES